MTRVYRLAYRAWMLYSFSRCGRARTVYGEPMGLEELFQYRRRRCTF